jgi:hypothetical protein
MSSDTSNFIVTFECTRCGKQHTDEDTIYRQTFYEDREETDIEPEPTYRCPDHPKAIVNMLMEETLRGQSDLK